MSYNIVMMKDVGYPMSSRFEVKEESLFLAIVELRWRVTSETVKQI